MSSAASYDVNAAAFSATRLAIPYLRDYYWVARVALSCRELQDVSNRIVNFSFSDPELKQRSQRVTCFVVGDPLPFRHDVLAPSSPLCHLTNLSKLWIHSTPANYHLAELILRQQGSNLSELGIYADDKVNLIARECEFLNAILSVPPQRLPIFTNLTRMILCTHHVFDATPLAHMAPNLISLKLGRVTKRSSPIWASLSSFTRLEELYVKAAIHSQHDGDDTFDGVSFGEVRVPTLQLLSIKDVAQSGKLEKELLDAAKAISHQQYEGPVELYTLSLSETLPEKMAFKWLIKNDTPWSVVLGQCAQKNIDTAYLRYLQKHTCALIPNPRYFSTRQLTIWKPLVGVGFDTFMFLLDEFKNHLSYRDSAGDTIWTAAASNTRADPSTVNFILNDLTISYLDTEKPSNFSSLLYRVRPNVSVHDSSHCVKIAAEASHMHFLVSIMNHSRANVLLDTADFTECVALHGAPEAVVNTFLHRADLLDPRAFDAVVLSAAANLTRFTPSFGNAISAKVISTAVARQLDPLRANPRISIALFEAFRKGNTSFVEPWLHDPILREKLCSVHIQDNPPVALGEVLHSLQYINPPPGAAIDFYGVTALQLVLTPEDWESGFPPQFSSWSPAVQILCARFLAYLAITTGTIETPESLKTRLPMTPFVLNGGDAAAKEALYQMMEFILGRQYTDSDDSDCLFDTEEEAELVGKDAISKMVNALQTAHPDSFIFWSDYIRRLIKLALASLETFETQSRMSSLLTGLAFGFSQILCYSDEYSAVLDDLFDAISKYQIHYPDSALLYSVAGKFDEAAKTASSGSFNLTPISAQNYTMVSKLLSRCAAASSANAAASKIISTQLQRTLQILLEHALTRIQ